MISLALHSAVFAFKYVEEFGFAALQRFHQTTRQHRLSLMAALLEVRALRSFGRLIGAAEQSPTDYRDSSGPSFLNSTIRRQPD